MQLDQIVVTPTFAAELLARNDANRGLYPKRVAAYARDMAAGDWRPSPHGIVLGKDGRLLDGQHRLNAVIRSGVNVPMTVIRDASDECQAILDRGRARSTADVLTMEGVKYPRVIASAAGLVQMLETGRDEILTVLEIRRVFSQRHRALQWTQSVRIPTRFGAAPIIAPVMWVHQAFEDEAVLFFDELVRGGPPESAAQALREHVFLRSSSRKKRDRLELVMNTLNCIRGFIEGEEVRYFAGSTNGWEWFRKRMGKPPVVASPVYAKLQRRRRRKQ